LVWADKKAKEWTEGNTGGVAKLRQALMGFEKKYSWRFHFIANNGPSQSLNGWGLSLLRLFDLMDLHILRSCKNQCRAPFPLSFTFCPARA
jgi:hypothetical protein